VVDLPRFVAPFTTRSWDKKAQLLLSAIAQIVCGITTPWALMTSMSNRISRALYPCRPHRPSALHPADEDGGQPVNPRVINFG
jgi:hypothetical protein